MESIEIELQPQAYAMQFVMQFNTGLALHKTRIEEQIDLHAMKSVLFAMMLELQFEEQ